MLRSAVERHSPERLPYLVSGRVRLAHRRGSKGKISVRNADGVLPIQGRDEPVVLSANRPVDKACMLNRSDKYRPQSMLAKTPYYSSSPSPHRHKPAGPWQVEFVLVCPAAFGPILRDARLRQGSGRAPQEEADGGSSLIDCRNKRSGNSTQNFRNAAAKISNRVSDTSSHL